MKVLSLASWSFCDLFIERVLHVDHHLGILDEIILDDLAERFLLLVGEGRSAGRWGNRLGVCRAAGQIAEGSRRRTAKAAPSPPQRATKAVRLLADAELTAFRKMLFKVIDLISLIRIEGSSRLRLVIDDVVVFQPLR